MRDCCRFALSDALMLQRWPLFTSKILASQLLVLFIAGFLLNRCRSVVSLSMSLASVMCQRQMRGQGKQNMNILLTGAFGNIGASALDELVKRKHHVRCFDLKTRSNETTAKQFGDKIEISGVIFAMQMM